MPRRRRHSNLIRNLLLAILLAILLLMAVSPLVETLLPSTIQSLDRLEWTRSRVMEALVALWFFAFGSMVGSFINVVVWRMPRGVSVVSHGSACPWCTSPIKLKDNIPIFGWIKLRGRCRVCRLPISPRYPIVETIFGLVFLLMFFVELRTACGNLPGGQRYLSTGILQVVVNTKWDVILTYGWHIMLLVMLMTWSLMAFDRSRIPIKTIVFAIATGFGVPALFPYVQPVKWIASLEQWLPDLPWIQRGSTAFIGLIVGLFLGSLLEAVLVLRSRDSNNGLAITTCLLTIGLFAGWQFAMIVVFIFGLLMAIRKMVEWLKPWPICSLLALATLVHLCLWKPIDDLTNNIGSIPEPAISVACALLGGVLAWFAGGEDARVAVPSNSEQEPTDGRP